MKLVNIDINVIHTLFSRQFLIIKMKRLGKFVVFDMTFEKKFLLFSFHSLETSPFLRGYGRSCEIGRDGNVNFAMTAGNAGKKTRERRFRNCTAWPGSITRLLWLRQWRMFFPAREKTSFLSLSSSSLSLVSIRNERRAKPHKGNIADRASTASSATSLISSTSFSLASFFFVYLYFFVFLRSSHQANLLGRYTFGSSVLVCVREYLASLFAFLILIFL